MVFWMRSFVFYHPGVNFVLFGCFEFCLLFLLDAMLFVRACSLVFVFFTSEFNGSLLQLIVVYLQYAGSISCVALIHLQKQQHVSLQLIKSILFI